MQYYKSWKMQFCVQLHVRLGEINLHLQANPYQLKTKNINSLVFISTIIKYLMLMIFIFVLKVWFFKKEKERV